VVLVLPGQSRRGGLGNPARRHWTQPIRNAIGTDLPAVAGFVTDRRYGSQNLRNENWNRKRMQGVGADNLTVRNWNSMRRFFFDQ